MLLWHEGNMFQMQVACHRLPKSLTSTSPWPSTFHCQLGSMGCFAIGVSLVNFPLTRFGWRMLACVCKTWYPEKNTSRLDTLNKHHSPTIRPNFPNLPKLGVAKGEHTTYIEKSTCSNFSKRWSNLPKWPKYYQSKIRKQEIREIENGTLW